MIYHVTQSGRHPVVTVNTDTAEDAARIAILHSGSAFWGGVELTVYDSQGGAWPVSYERAEAL